MKNYLLYLSIISLTLFSCSDADPEVYNAADGAIAYFTSGTESKFPVKEEDTEGTEKFVRVGVTTQTSTNRTFQIQILEDDDPEDDMVYADPSQYTIDQSSLVIPAGSFVGDIRIVSNYDTLPDEGSVYIKIQLTSLDGGVILGENNIYTVELYRSCVIEDFPLEYNAFPFAFNEQAPTYPVTFVEVVNEENTFRVSSGWGPNFVAWATGDPSYNGQFIYSGTIIINCDFSVVFLGDDSWATGGTGTYNPNTGVITVTLTQALFTSPFTVTTEFIPAS